jgi:hypothetical protein
MKELVTHAKFKAIILCAAALSCYASGSAQVLVSTLPSTANNVWNIGGGGFVVAQEFTTGSQSANIASVSFDTGLFFNYSGGDPLLVSIYSDASGTPGSVVSGGSLTGPASLTQNTLTTFNASGLTLAANTAYWLVFDSHDPNATIRVNNTASPVLDSNGNPGWSVGQTDYDIQGYAPTVPYSGAVPLFSINGAVVPEPGAMALFGVAGLCLWHFGRRAKS